MGDLLVPAIKREARSFSRLLFLVTPSPEGASQHPKRYTPGSGLKSPNFGESRYQQGFWSSFTSRSGAALRHFSCVTGSRNSAALATTHEDRVVPRVSLAWRYLSYTKLGLAPEVRNASITPAKWTRINAARGVEEI